MKEVLFEVVRHCFGLQEELNHVHGKGKLHEESTLTPDDFAQGAGPTGGTGSVFPERRDNGMNARVA